MKGTLFIISAPSGTGKTTILKEIIGHIPRISFSVSHTTRQPRRGERDGVDYFFVDKESFTEMQERDDFLEWAEVHGNFYGTGKQSVTDQLNQGRDIVLDIDVQGAEQLRRSSIEAVFIFITPPSWQELEKRLTERGTDDKTTIALRLKNARKEMKDAGLYEYVIINDTVSEAADVLRAIILEKRCRNKRAPDGTPLNLPDLS